jgi:hypothetical protein
MSYRSLARTSARKGRTHALNRNTGATIKGSVNKNVSFLTVLEEQATGWEAGHTITLDGNSAQLYVVTEVAKKFGGISRIDFYPYHLQSILLRRTAGSTDTLVTGIPTMIASTNGSKYVYAIPAGYPVQQGDVLQISGDQFRIDAIMRGDNFPLLYTERLAA